MADHEIKYPKEFTTALRKFEAGDRGHADVFNVPVAELINNDAYLKEQVDRTESSIQEHSGSGDMHVSTADREVWDRKAEKTTATASAAGLMSAADKGKLDGTAAGAEGNQNAFAGVKAGNVTVLADGKSAGMELAAGTNISIAADNTAKKIIITGAEKVRNPSSLVLQLNGTQAASYDGGEARTVNITPAGIGAVDSAGTITAGQVAAFADTAGNIKSSGFTIAASVPAGAQFTDTVYTHPASAGYKHIPAGGEAGQVLKNTEDGRAVWADNDGGFVAAAAAPANTRLLWVDTGTGILKYHNGTAWVPTVTAWG